MDKTEFLRPTASKNILAIIIFLVFLAPITSYYLFQIMGAQSVLDQYFEGMLRLFLPPLAFIWLLIAFMVAWGSLIGIASPPPNIWPYFSFIGYAVFLVIIYQISYVIACSFVLVLSGKKHPPTPST